MNPKATLDTITEHSGIDPHEMENPDVARLIINENRVLEQNTVPGLTVKVRELTDGVDVTLSLADDTVVRHPVHLCFGVIPEEGVQHIIMNVNIGARSKISMNAHCTFPFAKKVIHRMDANINLAEDSQYSYFERHVHSQSGGIEVIPKTEVFVGPRSRFKTEFELIKGRVGIMDISYIAHAAEKAAIDMTARINGKGNDVIKISEIACLEGIESLGVLTSKIAVRDSARAEVFNKVTALAAHSRGHVDCKEIVKDRGIATANPVVDVRHPQAHVTHEAAVGSVDKKQLETLMARGLDEDEASELIIQGLLS